MIKILRSVHAFLSGNFFHSFGEDFNGPDNGGEHVSGALLVLVLANSVTQKTMLKCIEVTEN